MSAQFGIFEPPPPLVHTCPPVQIKILRVLETLDLHTQTLKCMHIPACILVEFQFNHYSVKYI